jgi:hypothetical protein
MFVSHATRQAALLALFSSQYCASRMATATFLQQCLPFVFDEFSHSVLLHWYNSDLHLQINQLLDHAEFKRRIPERFQPVPSSHNLQHPCFLLRIAHFCSRLAAIADEVF